MLYKNNQTVEYEEVMLQDYNKIFSDGSVTDTFTCSIKFLYIKKGTSQPFPIIEGQCSWIQLPKLNT